MAKRKFGLRSLFTGRTGRSAKDQEIEDWGSDSDGYNDAHPFDPSEVNRPPKLDNRTEAELRKACAIIVENLKPSGHDLEDTRMQSDILVDNPDIISNKHPLPQKALSIPQPGATWYQEGSTRSSQLSYPKSAVKSTDKRSSTNGASGPPPEYAALDQKSSRVLKAQREQLSPPIGQPESPLAPLQTQAVQSRDVASPVSKRVTETKATPGTRNDSSSSMSNYDTSENGIRSSSTGATSANYTPSPTSKRASDAVRPEPSRTAAAAAAAGAWMKQEIERRRQTEEMYSQDESQSQSIPEDDSAALDSTSNTTQLNTNIVDKSKMDLPNEVNGSSYPSTTLATSALQPDLQLGSSPDAPSGTLSGPFEQPSYVENDTEDLHETNSQPIEEPVRGVRFKEVNRVPSVSNGSSSVQTSDSSKLAETYQKSIEQDTTLLTGDDENLEPAKAKRRTSKRLSKENPKLKTQGQSNKSENGALSPPLPTSPGLPKPRQSWPVPPPPKPKFSPDSVPQIPQIPPLPNKHQFDDSIVVKDFVQPTSAPRVTALQKSISPDRRPVRPGDVEAADFDSFMSVVEERGDDNVVVTKLDSPTPVGSPEQASPRMNGEKSPISDAPPQPRTMSSLSEASNGDVPKQPAETLSPTLQSNRASSTVQNVDSERELQPRPQSQSISLSEMSSRPQSEPSPILPPQPPQRLQVRAPELEQRQVLSPPIASPRTTEQRSAVVVTSSRTSISASLGPSAPSHSRSQSLSRKSPSGFKRILTKFSNADRGQVYVNSGYGQQKRKIFSGYAPGAYVPGYGLNGGIEEDEERFDEQACAAPVVGFGRGW